MRNYIHKKGRGKQQTVYIFSCLKISLQIWGKNYYLYGLTLPPNFIPIVIYDRERPSFEDSNNVTVQRCFFAYEFAESYITGKTAADVGCANGYGTVHLAKFATQITGLDYSTITVENNKKEYADKPNMSFIQCKVPPIALPDESVDVVTAFQFIEHIQDQLGFIKDVKRVLRPGGVFICTTPNASMSIARNPFHVHEYTFAEMKGHMEQVFGSNYELMGLNGNAVVNKYYEDNSRWAKRILRLDPLGLHKLIPASWLIKPYNYLTSKMRKNLKESNSDTLNISTKDFILQKENLDVCWDIFAVARK